MNEMNIEPSSNLIRNLQLGINLENTRQEVLRAGFSSALAWYQVIAFPGRTGKDYADVALHVFFRAAIDTIDEHKLIS